MSVDRQAENGQAMMGRYVDLPWFALKPHSLEKNIFSADARPLTLEDLNAITKPRSAIQGLALHRSEIRQANKALLDATDTVAIVLDGRTSIHNQGYIGDMIEATRLVSALRKDNRVNVHIITSHTDIFEGTTDKGVQISPIPSDIPPATDRPWQPRLRRFLGELAEGKPVFFPINASLPLLLKFDQEGEITNSEDIHSLNRYLSNNVSSETNLRPELWWRRGVHQLQALQMNADLIGLEDAYNWQEFPNAYLYPDHHAQAIGSKVANLYRCFYKSNPTSDVPLLIHPGVATNGRKVELKYYPESRWKKVLDSLRENGSPIRNLTVLKPVSPEQAAAATRIAEHSMELGIKTAVIPEEELRRTRGWSLGAFISFLQEFSNHKGIIAGCDSMPAGHAGPAIDVAAVVLASPRYNPGFYGPPRKAFVVLPEIDKRLLVTKDINPKCAAQAINDMANTLIA